jgi:ribosomal protein S18 acetylase RimI-like enzyme
MTNEADRRSPAPHRSHGSVANRPTAIVLRAHGTAYRVRPWPNEPGTAHLVLYQQPLIPSRHDLDRWCEQLAAAGFGKVRTSALAAGAAMRVEAAGFVSVQELVLLAHDELRSIPAPGVPTGRLLVDQHARAAAVDVAAFDPQWSLDPSAVTDVCHATPRHRGRTAGVLPGQGFAAYAITGRDSRQGFIQRLAVDPASQRQGLGRALVLDSLRWLSRWRVQRALVNTPTDNLGALALYERVGFTQLAERLKVYEREVA